MGKFVASNRVDLLKGSAAFFASLIEAIDLAAESIWIETYILSDDASVLAVLNACKQAANRGVAVHLTVDGFGSGPYGRSLMQTLPASGVQMRIFRPERWWRMSRRLLRRMHRKLAVIDDRIAFVAKRVNHIQKLSNIVEVKPCCGFVQNIDCFSGIAF